MITINEFSNKMKYMMTQSSFFFVLKFFLHLKLHCVTVTKFSFFFLSFRTKRPDDGRVLHAKRDDLGEGLSSPEVEERQLDRGGRSGPQRRHLGVARRAPSGAPPRQRRDS
jgi:hypothetical protein